MTSTSKSSMTPSIISKVSIKPFTATRSIRFVVALYSMYSTVPEIPSASGPWAAPIFSNKNDRRTRGESSASTWVARRADEARRNVGRGTAIVLNLIQGDAYLLRYCTYSEQGKSGSMVKPVITIVDGAKNSVPQRSCPQALSCNWREKPGYQVLPENLGPVTIADDHVVTLV